MKRHILRRRLAALLLTFTLPAFALAEEVPQEETHVFKNIPAELASPWTTDARSWLLVGSALSLGVAFSEANGNKTQAQMAKDKPLGDWAKIGDYAGQLIPNALYLGGMYTAYWITHDKKYKKHGLIMLKASAYAGGTALILKGLIREQRPNKTDWHSFPSGHSTTAFAFASVISAEHGFWPYGLGATLLATLTAVSRLNDNMHHERDVMAGATIGTAFGLGVSYFNRALEKNEVKAAVLPLLDNEFAGVQVVLPFPF
jgi:membrane-associated phospholipid phosphatase